MLRVALSAGFRANELALGRMVVPPRTKPEKGDDGQNSHGQGNGPCVFRKLNLFLVASRNLTLSVLFTGHSDMPSQSGRELGPSRIRERVSLSEDGQSSYG